jgi:hypothetical protein
MEGSCGSREWLLTMIQKGDAKIAEGSRYGFLETV